MSATVLPDPLSDRRSEGWFYLGTALTTAAIAIVGFAPALLDPAGRQAPLTWAVAAHDALVGAYRHGQNRRSQ